MKRLLLLAALGTTAGLLPTSAHATICVTNNGREVVCVEDAAHIELPPRTCVTHGSWTVICVP